MSTETVVEEGRCRTLEWAVYATPFPGQQRSGDAFLVQETAAGALIAVLDVLGHGDDAADVAAQALASLRCTAGRSPTDSLTACHAALRGTRGAALTVVDVDLDRGRLVWVSVGNVEATVVRPGNAGRSTSRWTVPQRGGVVGDRLPPLRESTAALTAGDILVSVTDGIRTDFIDGVDLSLQTPTLAALLHAGYAKSDDDALVLVARCLSRSTADDRARDRQISAQPLVTNLASVSTSPKASS